jgi:hypothetical protein
MMEAINVSETSATFYQTAQLNIPKDSHLHARRRHNLKFHVSMLSVENTYILIIHGFIIFFNVFSLAFSSVSPVLRARHLTFIFCFIAYCFLKVSNMTFITPRGCTAQRNLFVNMWF